MEPKRYDRYYTKDGVAYMLDESNRLFRYDDEKREYEHIGFWMDTKEWEIRD